MLVEFKWWILQEFGLDQHQELKALKDQRVLKEDKGLKEVKVLKVLKEQLGHKV
jgi:hypothetical protein